MSREQKSTDKKRERKQPESKKAGHRPDKTSRAGQHSTQGPTSQAGSSNSAPTANQSSTSDNSEENNEHDDTAIVVQVPEKPRGQTPASTETTTIVTNAPPKTKPSVKRNYTKNPTATKKVCLRSDNSNLNMEKAELGKPEPNKTRIKILCTDGTYKKDKWKNRKEDKWDDKTWISALNKWRAQRFTVAFKGDKSDKKTAKTRWSHAELQLLEWQIRKKVTNTGDYLSSKDFQEFAQVHNKRFEGKEIKIGERLADGKAATTIQVIGARTQQALKTLYNKTPEFKEIVETLVKQYNTDTNDEYSSDEDMEEAKDNEDGKQNGNNGLEEDSDDEMDGCRPAAQPTGGIPVPAI